MIIKILNQITLSIITPKLILTAPDCKLMCGILYSNDSVHFFVLKSRLSNFSFGSVKSTGPSWVPPLVLHYIHSIKFINFLPNIYSKIFNFPPHGGPMSFWAICSHPIFSGNENSLQNILLIIHQCETWIN